MTEPETTHRLGCYENLAYHLAQSRWFLERLGMKALHDNVRDIQEQVQRKWDIEKRAERDKGTSE